MTITNVVVWPASPVCLGTTLYAWPEYSMTSNVVVTTSWCDNATTNCPTSYSTNIYWPSSISNSWVVSHPGFSGSGNESFVAFTPTNCGTGTVKFSITYCNFNPCTGEKCGEKTIDKTVSFEVVNVQIAEPEVFTCVSSVTGFSLTNSCGSVTWEVWPEEPDGPTVNGGAITAGTQCGTWTVIARSTINTNCTASASLTVVDVEGLSPAFATDDGGFISDSDPPTYWVCPCNGDVIVTASACPALTADQLPACWTFTGGVAIDKLHHKVSKESLLSGPVTFTVTAGSSTKTIILKADEEMPGYSALVPQQCLNDNFNDPSPWTDKCGNTLSINCVGARGWPFYSAGHYEYRYNGILVGTCYYNGGENVFLFKTTKNRCRILRTWHLTQKPVSPTKWVVTKYN
ncbi:MAG: hypothetical protein ACR2H1_10365, partial [Limisphaerales bacterium]